VSDSDICHAIMPIYVSCDFVTKSCPDRFKHKKLCIYANMEDSSRRDWGGVIPSNYYNRQWFGFFFWFLLVTPALRVPAIGQWQKLKYYTSCVDTINISNKGAQKVAPAILCNIHFPNTCKEEKMVCTYSMYLPPTPPVHISAKYL